MLSSDHGVSDRILRLRQCLLATPDHTAVRKGRNSPKACTASDVSVMLCSVQVVKYNLHKIWGNAGVSGGN